MVLGQSAAVAACLALDQGKDVQDVAIEDINRVLDANPKGDGRRPDVFIDFRNPDAIQLTGEWNTATRRGYGRTYKQTEGKKGGATARFMADATESGYYNVYTYFPRLTKSATKVLYRIFDGE